MRLLFSGGTGACGDCDRARGELTRRTADPNGAPSGGGVDGCGGGVPTSFLPTWRGLLAEDVAFLPCDGVRLDFDLCISPEEDDDGEELWWGLWDRFSERFPMDEADLSLCTLGFSGTKTGLGILESQGMSGEGGCSFGEGPSSTPLATLNA